MSLIKVDRIFESLFFFFLFGLLWLTSTFEEPLQYLIKSQVGLEKKTPRFNWYSNVPFYFYLFLYSIIDDKYKLQIIIIDLVILFSLFFPFCLLNLVPESMCTSRIRLVLVRKSKRKNQTGDAKSVLW